MMMHQQYDHDRDHHMELEDGIPRYLSHEHIEHERQDNNNLVYPPRPSRTASPAPHQLSSSPHQYPYPPPPPHDQLTSYPYPPIPGPSLLEPQHLQLQLYQPQEQHQPFGWADNQQQAPPNCPDQIRQSWSTGLCDCCDDIGSCLLSCLFPCYVFGKIAEIIDEGNTSCKSHCAIFSVLSCLLYPSLYSAYLYGGQACCGMEGEALSVLAWYSAPFLYTCFFRQRMRRKYRLRDAPLWDWLAHLLCMPCSLSQEYRELQARGFLVSQSWEQNLENQSRTSSMPQIAPPLTYPGMTR